MPCRSWPCPCRRQSCCLLALCTWRFPRSRGPTWRFHSTRTVSSKYSAWSRQREYCRAMAAWLRDCTDNTLSPRSRCPLAPMPKPSRSEEHTSELQSHLNLVCRLLLEKKKNKYQTHNCARKNTT